MDSRIITIFLVSCALTQIAQSQRGLNGICYDCICKATTGCPDPKDDLPEGGRYGITQDYWATAGSYTTNIVYPDAISNWKACVANERCSRITIWNFMDKFERDCNGDGVINCDDLVRIHHFGPHACNQPDSPLIERYKRCFA